MKIAENLCFGHFEAHQSRLPYSKGLPAAVIVLLCFFAFAGNAQDVSNSDTTDFAFGIDFSRKSYLLGDLAVTIQGNRSGVGMSRAFRELGFNNGFGVSIESYTPVMPMAFFNYGIGYSNKSFRFSPEEQDVDVHFKLNFIEVPLFLSYELPELRSVDFRFLIGTQLSYMFGANRHGEYSTSMLENRTLHVFNEENFTPFDFGLLFGLSFEYKAFYLRCKGVVGTVMLDAPNTGQFNAFSLDIGVFPFRLIQQK